MKTRYFIFTLIVLGLAFIESCKKDSFLSGEGTLEMSTDSVYFDTVFTRIVGQPYPRSYNKRLVVKNPYKEFVKVNINLAGDGHSPFRLNIDGIPSNSIKDYEIAPEDSIYIFVEVTLEPNNLNQPAIIKDSILFTTGGRQQKVILAAYGWDAHYYRDSVVDMDVVWDDKVKPYVIVSSMLMSPNRILTIKDGVTVYASPDSRMYIQGTLKVEGIKGSRVVFRGDRLDRNFEDVSSQWIGIHLLRNSGNNVIKYADIKNAIIGIQVDSLPNVPTTPNLTIENTRIMNMGNIGILGITAYIKATNCAITNCNTYTFLGYFGGAYDLRNCTFANGNSSSRRDPHFVLNSVQRNENELIIKNYPLEYNLQNDIIYGFLDDEIGFDTPNNPPVLENVEYCIIKSKNKDLISNNNLINNDPKLMDIDNNNVELDSLSPAKDKAKIIGVNIDLPGNNRGSKPDIGAFESKF